jgi:hypothetical protein
MKILRVGDKVRVVRRAVCTKKGTIDIIQEAEYNPNGETMDYALLHSGAWFHNDDLEFVSSDGGKELVEYLREHEDDY